MRYYISEIRREEDLIEVDLGRVVSQETGPFEVYKEGTLQVGEFTQHVYVVKVWFDKDDLHPAYFGKGDMLRITVKYLGTDLSIFDNKRQYKPVRLKFHPDVKWINNAPPYHSKELS